MRGARAALALGLWTWGAAAAIPPPTDPHGPPAASVDLTRREGVALVRGTWRYADARIVETLHRSPDADGQPTGAPVSTWDLHPRAGARDFDDSAWPPIAPESLSARRSTGRLCFGWYRIRVTVPERIGDFDPTGSTLVFETAIDDYGEVWVEGELPRGLGQRGGSVVAGWNAPNRLVIARGVRAGQTIQLAVFGANGPLSDPPANFVWMRSARLDFYREAPSGPWALPAVEVNVEVERRDPALDAIVPANPKVHKLAEGLDPGEAPVWVRDGGYLLLRDPAAGPGHRYDPGREGALSPADAGAALVPGRSGGGLLDRAGNRYLPTPAGIEVSSPDGRRLGTIRPPRAPLHLAWGDDDGRGLYMTSHGALYRMRLGVEGMRP